jgi:DNA-binding NarL/FixJ family response regulator
MIDTSEVLSPSELKVALLVARGLTNKEVARELGLGEGTVKAHLHNIFRKLSIQKRRDLRNSNNGKSCIRGGEKT